MLSKADNNWVLLGPNSEERGVAERTDEAFGVKVGMLSKAGGATE